jgi:hypothetical protein
MVYVLLDGDGAIFRDDLIAKGEEGGTEAAHLLQAEIVKYLQDRYPESNVNDWSIIVQVWLNMEGCSRKLHQAGVTTDNHTQLQSFLKQFCRAQPLFSVVDVGYGKEEADHKWREMLRVMSKVTQCKHLIYGPCHDSGSVPVIRQFAGDQAMRLRMTLLEAIPAHPKFTELGFQHLQIPSVFRNESLPEVRPNVLAQRPTNASNGFVLPGRPASNSNGMNLPFAGGLQRTTESPAPSGSSPPTSWAKTTGMNASAKEFNLVTNKKASSGPKYYLVNAQDERLDIDLPRQSPLAEKSFNEKITAQGHNFCNDYHLGGYCPNEEYCQYEHGERLKGPELLVLRHKARSLLCREGTYCSNPDCYSGHVCKWGKKCTYDQCRFYETHYVDIVSEPQSPGQLV